MSPSWVIWLSSIPIASTGKGDRASGTWQDGEKLPPVAQEPCGEKTGEHGLWDPCILTLHSRTKPQRVRIHRKKRGKAPGWEVSWWARRVMGLHWARQGLGRGQPQVPPGPHLLAVFCSVDRGGARSMVSGWVLPRPAPTGVSGPTARELPMSRDPGRPARGHRHVPQLYSSNQWAASLDQRPFFPLQQEASENLHLPAAIYERNRK